MLLRQPRNGGKGAALRRGFEGHASATWTSAASSEQTRLGGYVRETFAYLYYRVAGR